MMRDDSWVWSTTASVAVMFALDLQSDGREDDNRLERVLGLEPNNGTLLEQVKGCL
jgi:hypothetical protein